jgi:hypothetical protein
MHGNINAKRQSVVALPVNGALLGQYRYAFLCNNNFYLHEVHKLIAYREDSDHKSEYLFSKWILITSLTEKEFSLH